MRYAKFIPLLVLCCGLAGCSSGGSSSTGGGQFVKPDAVVRAEALLQEKDSIAFAHYRNHILAVRAGNYNGVGPSGFFNGDIHLGIITFDDELLSQSTEYIAWSLRHESCHVEQKHHVGNYDRFKDEAYCTNTILATAQNLGMSSDEYAFLQNCGANPQDCWGNLSKAGNVGSIPIPPRNS